MGGSPPQTTAMALELVASGLERGDAGEAARIRRIAESWGAPGDGAECWTVSAVKISFYNNHYK